MKTIIKFICMSAVMWPTVWLLALGFGYIIKDEFLGFLIVGGVLELYRGIMNSIDKK